MKKLNHDLPCLECWTLIACLFPTVVFLLLWSLSAWSCFNGRGHTRSLLRSEKQATWCKAPYAEVTPSRDDVCGFCVSSAYSARFSQPSGPAYQRRRVAPLCTLAQVQVIFVHRFDYTPICSVSMATLCSLLALMFIAPISDRCKLEFNANCILSAWRQPRSSSSWYIRV